MFRKRYVINLGKIMQESDYTCIYVYTHCQWIKKLLRFAHFFFMLHGILLSVKCKSAFQEEWSKMVIMK